MKLKPRVNLQGLGREMWQNAGKGRGTRESSFEVDFQGVRTLAHFISETNIIRSAFQKDLSNSDLSHTHLSGKSKALFVMSSLLKRQIQPLSKSMFHHCFQTLLTQTNPFSSFSPSGTPLKTDDYSLGKKK